MRIPKEPYKSLRARYYQNSEPKSKMSCGQEFAQLPSEKDWRSCRDGFLESVDHKASFQSFDPDGAPVFFDIEDMSPLVPSPVRSLKRKASDISELGTPNKAKVSIAKYSTKRGADHMDKVDRYEIQPKRILKTRSFGKRPRDHIIPDNARKKAYIPIKKRGRGWNLAGNHPKRAFLVN